MKTPSFHTTLAVACAALLSSVLVSCGGASSRAAVSEGPQAETAATETVRAFTTVQPSAKPIWFEFGSEGPVAIDVPGRSSLVPFAPWPLARRSCGFVVREGLIAMGANRDGFIVFAPRKNGAVSVYRISDPAAFGKYSIATLFSFRDQPTAILYRDHFFVDSSDPSPAPRAYSAVPGKGEPVPVDLPVLSGFPPADGWDVEGMERAADGRWFFRAVRRPGTEKGDGEPAFAVAQGPDSAAEPSTAAAFRGAMLPRSADSAEAVLRLALAAVATTLDPSGLMVVSACGPGAVSAEDYLVSRSAVKNVDAALSAASSEVKRAWASSDGSRAYLVTAAGETYTAVGRDREVVRSHLPALPIGFSYTGISTTRNLAVVSWEEQDGWAVGAAGFLVISAGALVGLEEDDVL